MGQTLAVVGARHSAAEFQKPFFDDQEEDQRAIGSAEHGVSAPAGSPNGAAEKKAHIILVLFILTLTIALLAQWRVKRAYARHSRTPTLSGYTGAEVADQILRQAGVTNVEIVEHEELLGDHYDPLPPAWSAPPAPWLWLR